MDVERLAAKAKVKYSALLLMLSSPACPQTEERTASDINWASLSSFRFAVMNRTELVEILAFKNDLSKTAANAVLDTLIETIQIAVKKGDAVQLVGFGTFKSAKRAARTGKNPATGAALKIPASTVPKFVAGAKFKAVVDPKAAKRKAEKAGK